MKFAILTTSALALSATLVSGTAYAQSQTVTVQSQGGPLTCQLRNQQLFSCEPVKKKKVYYIPPTWDPYPPEFFRPGRPLVKEMGEGGTGGEGGNEGGGGGGRGGRAGGKP